MQTFEVQIPNTQSKILVQDPKGLLLMGDQDHDFDLMNLGTTGSIDWGKSGIMIDPQTGEPMKGGKKKPVLVNPATGLPYTAPVNPVTGMPLINPATGKPFKAPKNAAQAAHQAAVAAAAQAGANPWAPPINPITGKGYKAPINPVTGQPLINPATGQPFGKPKTNAAFAQQQAAAAQVMQQAQAAGAAPLAGAALPGTFGGPVSQIAQPVAAPQINQYTGMPMVDPKAQQKVFKNQQKAQKNMFRQQKKAQQAAAEAGMYVQPQAAPIVQQQVVAQPVAQPQVNINALANKYGVPMYMLI